MSCRNQLRKAAQKLKDIFAGYFDLQAVVGADANENNALRSYSNMDYADKIAAGLQQFIAGVRKFSVNELNRSDIFSANRETEKETGIPFITDVNDEKAKAILKA